MSDLQYQLLAIKKSGGICNPDFQFVAIPVIGCHRPLFIGMGDND